MIITKYSKADESLLFDMLVDEGDEWSDYHGSVGRSKYYCHAGVFVKINWTSHSVCLILLRCTIGFIGGDYIARLLGRVQYE